MLPGQPTTDMLVGEPDGRRSAAQYDPVTGDDDLYAGDLSGWMWRLVAMGVVFLALLLGGGIGFIVGQMDGDDDEGQGDTRAEVTVSAPSEMPASVATLSPDAGSDDADDAASFFETPASTTPSPPPVTPPRSPSATMSYPTVTPAPPTPTITPTPGPCMQKANQGDTVFDLALRCGHRDWAVVDAILDLNGMQSATELQVGQTLEIPWPTPTPGGPPTETPSGPDTGASGNPAAPVADGVAAVNEFGTPNALATYQNIEPTLRPGQAWHTVSQGETIIDVAYRYDTSVELLSQINPEVPFLQCDFGERYGGPNCSVMLFEDMRLRVPVSLPTTTPTPSPVGTLTPTPTATATFNAPYLVKPKEGTHFYSDEQVTLRWGGTGTLAEDERYLARVRDLDTGDEYTALVPDTMYVLPGGWQPTDRERHTFEWTISVVTIDDEFNILTEDYVTEARQFTWDSR